MSGERWTPTVTDIEEVIRQSIASAMREVGTELLAEVRKLGERVRDLESENGRLRTVEKWLTAEQKATQLGLTPDTLRRSASKFGGVKLGNGRWRFPEAITSEEVPESVRRPQVGPESGARPRKAQLRQGGLRIRG